MAIHIEMVDETEQVSEVSLQLIEEVLKKAAELEDVTEDYEVSVTLVDNETIREINREYRGIDAVTDVISFALNDEGEDELQIIGGAEEQLLGDIIISIPRASEQAESYGHSFERELAFLAVHGFLHLLGYDHMTEEDEKTMFAKQEDILQAYGLTR
ncbi:MAG TPA: rRNA maturation RNase YbeY [Bacilli bacterium]|nr:rRNA maturation RNase YbeY [Bacilli bacterium]